MQSHKVRFSRLTLPDLPVARSYSAQDVQEHKRELRREHVEALRIAVYVLNFKISRADAPNSMPA